MKYFILLIGIFFSFCGNKTKNETKNDSLVFVKSIEGFQTPESVLYYPPKNILFISNINGKPTDIDSNGFISTIDTSGKILNLRWIEGLNAPKGMFYFENTLYVTDIDQLIVIDIVKDEIIDKIKVENSKFLNDIAIDKKGEVYISDSNTGTVYKYFNGKIEEYISDLEGANGLLIDNDTLFIGFNKKILKASIENQKIYDTIDVPTGVDGIRKLFDNNFIISDWRGNINKVNPKQSKLLLSTVDKKNAADFELVGNKLFVPTFFDNRIDIYFYKKQ